MDYRDYNDRKYDDYVSSRDDMHRRRTRSNQSSGNIRKGSSERVKKRIKQRENQKKRRTFFRAVGVAAIIVFMVCFVVGTGVGIGMYTAVSTEIKDMNINELALNHASYVMYTDANGEAQELDQIKTSVNRKWISSEEISENFKNAAVAIEDERFYKHHGVDIKRTIGATIKYALSKIGIGDASYGGSTITQQVIKNITNETDKSATRKIKEMMRAIALEKQITKDEILTMYLNIAFFANNCYGVEAASNMYFNKTAKEVNIQEAATIVGITQLPGKFNPYSYPENAIEKRNRVIGKMLEHKMITKEEYEKAVKSPLNVVPKRNSSSSRISSYFIDQVMNDVIADLQAKTGYSKDFAEQQITNGGIRIYSTIDPAIQDAIEQVLENKSNFPNSKAQTAMLVLDPYTGAVKGMVGGLGEKTSARGLNRATQAIRQPGSAIKPISVYGPAIDLGKIDQATVIKDEKITIGSDDWEPSNSYDGFKGSMIVHEAVGRSSNIPAVKVLDMIGINKSYSYLENNFRISTITSADKNYSSLALGGLTNGVTVKEMAAAYGVFVNQGKYIKPYTYTKVVDSSGQVILENKITSIQTIKPSTAFIMSDLLSEPVNGSYGTARSARLSNMPTYGKTGTTNDNYDKWFVGFTPYYVGAVWYGYDTPKSVGGSNPTTSVWRKVMEIVHQNLPEKNLQKPQDVVVANICTNSGNLAKSTCNSIDAYFVSGKQPKKICTNHIYDDPEESPSPSPEASEGPEGSENPEKTESPEETQRPAGSESPSKPETTKTPSPQKTEVPSKEE